MFLLRILLLLLHISSAAVVFAGPLGMTRNLRANLEIGGKALELAARDAARRAAFVGLGAIGTLATGVALIFLMGGFAVAPLNFHMALGLMFLALFVGLVVVRPQVQSIVKRTTNASAPADSEAIRSAIRRIAMGQGIQHLLWLGMLTLMFYRITRS